LDAIDAQEVHDIEMAARPQSWQLDTVPFTLFIGWWAVFNLLAYTLAGEKMPWLGTHLTVPMILLSGWYFGRIFERINWRQFQARGWIYLVLLPLVFIGLFQVISPYFSGQAPFQGTSSVQQQWTYKWIGVLVVSVGGIYGVLWLVQQTGWRAFRQMVALVAFVMLAVITFRSSWIASFINYDEASEFLVYAHAAPGNSFVIDKVRDLSLRTTDSMNIRILHDDRFSWPGSWYLRDFTNTLYFGASTPSAQEVENAAVIIVGDSNRSKIEPLVEGAFQRFDHLRMWWPMQDYFGLSAERINNLLDVDSAQAAGTRKGIFDIWWARDYSAYAVATANPNVPGKDADRFNIDKGRWPVSDSMSLYVRKDIVAQVWPYGVGDGDPSGPFTTVTENTCAINFEPRAASLVFENAGALRQPLGLAIGDNGVLYVAESEESTSRISMFDLDGTYLGNFGQLGAAQTDGAFFARPHSVAVAPNGDIVVVDTWNYRVRVFDGETKEMLAIWGQPLTAGEAAGREPLDGFWGPRDVVADAAGDIYVSDTGNKRIRVYDRDGNYVRDIGSAGTGDGQLNEPAGLAIAGNRLYVADTWNRRIAIFNLDGSFVKNVPVRGWYEEQGNRPYLAVDEARNLLYVTDPDAGRIMVHNLEGECLGSFGQGTDSNPDATQFRTVGGLAIDANGNLYASDLGAGRIVRFDPYEAPVLTQADADAEGAESEEAGAFPHG
jgi:DNA-binding beta-propeller fold protein YncE